LSITTVRNKLTLRALVALATLCFAGALAAQQPDAPQMQQQMQAPPTAPLFHATHYEIDAVLSPGNQTLFAKVQADFVADQTSRDLAVELSPDMAITAVQLDGQAVPFQRTASPLGVAITLPNAVPAGQKVTLTFDYVGQLAAAAGSPTAGVRLAYIGSDNAFMLLASRWFPVTSYIGQRYTAVIHLTVPPNMVVVSSGQSGAPDSVPEPQGAKPAGTAQWLRYTFTTAQPAAVGTIIASALELTPVNEGGISISVYTPPNQKSTAAAWAKQLADILAFYSSEFGPLPDRSITLAQLPNVATMTGVAAPGLLLVNQRQWTEQPPERLLARLAAHLWWGEQVMPATSSDAWLSSGLSRYSEILYEQHAHGDAALASAVEDCAVGALMDEKVAPITEAWRLDPYTTAYNSIVRDKGAMVFNMLRTSIGDNAFLSLLQEYFQKYSGKTATIADFQNLVQAKVASLPAPPITADSETPRLNTLAFFSQWVNSTGIPDFKLDYIVYRTQKGFKVVGKIEQNLTTLNMPIQIKVETEGNPVTKTVQIVGTSSEFTIDTFGQPKANGILLDPNNDVLKDTPGLRVRAMIAQGEALAEQGQFFQAIQQYQKALDVQRQNGLALFRMGESMFYEKNYQAAANSFRDAIDGIIDPSNKWIIVWSHIYLGKIYDLIGQRERAMNEYQKAIDTKDDTSGAIEQAQQYMKKPYGGEPAAHPGT
jgi:aminopeptidase N